MSSESDSSEETEQLVGLLRGTRMESRMEHQTEKRYKSIYFFTSVVGLVLVGMIISWCRVYKDGFGWSSEPDKQFNWHPVLMVIGLVFLYSQSMLIYRTGRKEQKKSLKLWHAILHFVSFICAVIGLVAVFDYHNNTNKPNLLTMHSWMGLVCVIIFALQFLGGFLAFLFPGFSLEIRKIILPVHVATGSGLFVLATGVSLMGLTEKAIWSSSYKEGLNADSLLVNFIGVLLAFYAIFCLYLVNEPTYKRQNLPEEQLALSMHAE